MQKPKNKNGWLYFNLYKPQPTKQDLRETRKANIIAGYKVYQQ